MTSVSRSHTLASVREQNAVIDPDLMVDYLHFKVMALTH